MKRFILYFIIYLFTITSGSSQTTASVCNNPLIKQQADSLKNIFLTDSFIVLREASLKMESEYESPVIVQLKKGNWYQFIFVGDKTSKLLELVMYDWEENQVFLEKNKKKDTNGNIISFSFIPKEDGYYMLKLLQINKKENNLCGYFIMMNKLK